MATIRRKSYELVGYDPETRVYTYRAADGAVWTGRKAADILAPPKPKPTMSQDIRAIREALTGGASEATAELLCDAADKHAARLTRAKKSVAHFARAKARAGVKPQKTDPAQHCERDETTAAAILFAAFAFVLTVWLASPAADKAAVVPSPISRR